MKTTEPCYDLIASLKKFGFEYPEDRKWQEVNLETFQKNFLKYSCGCSNIPREIVLKHFTFREGKNMAYFIGQCPRCDTIYWTQDTA